MPQGTELKFVEIGARLSDVDGFSFLRGRAQWLNKV